MPDKPKPHKNRSVKAVIIIADIENSSYYAETSSPAEYIRMIREYHKIASKSVDQYVLESRELADSLLVKRAYGDELLIILHSRRIAKDVSYALNLAVMLDVEWARSRFNSRRIKNDDTPCRLRLGIGYGQVNLQESVWNQGLTPEGYAIVQTKRLEAAAGGDIHVPHILIDAKLKKYAEKLSGVELGDVKTIPADSFRRNKSFDAVRVRSYLGLYNDFKQRIRSSNRYLRCFTRGYQAWSAGNYEESLHYYRKAVKARPDRFRALTNLAGILIHFNKLDEAEEICRKSLEMKHDYPLANTTLGSILVYKGKFKDAIKAYKEALKLQADDPIIHYNLGNAYSRLKKFKDASNSYQKALALRPDYLKALCNFAVIKRDMGEYAEALQLVEKAVQIEPHRKEIKKLLKEIRRLKSAENNKKTTALKVG